MLIIGFSRTELSFPDILNVNVSSVIITADVMSTTSPSAFGPHPQREIQRTHRQSKWRLQGVRRGNEATGVQNFVVETNRLESSHSKNRNEVVKGLNQDRVKAINSVKRTSIEFIVPEVR